MPNKTNPFQTKKSTKKSTKNPDKHIIEQLNRKNIPSIHNASETDKSTEKFSHKTFPDRHTINQKHIQSIEDQTNKQFQITIEQLYSNEYQRTIQSIQDLSSEMFKETLNEQQNLKNKAPNTTHTLNTIKKNAKQILKKTGEIKQILKNLVQSQDMRFKPTQQG